jgi:hypothetical protein
VASLLFKTRAIRVCQARKALLVSLLILSVSALLNASDFLGQSFISPEGASGQVAGGNLLFPNATTPVLGNQSIIPGLHVMSLVNGVKPTWVIISSDSELSVNLRHLGNGTSPAVSLLATGLKSPVEPQTLSSPNASTYVRLEGSNTTNTGWVSPATIPIKVEGGMSLYDADLIIVMVVPYTAPSNSSNASSITTQ